MKSIEIFDPAMCCSTGVCGPSPDQALVSFAGALEKLKSSGFSVTRHNLSQEPLAFANHPEVKAILEKQGEAGLPLIFIDHELYFRGAYPTADQLRQILKVDLAENQESNSCCSDEGDCCGEEPKKEPITFVKAAAPKAVENKCCDPSSGCC